MVNQRVRAARKSAIKRRRDGDPALRKRKTRKLREETAAVVAVEMVVPLAIHLFLHLAIRALTFHLLNYRWTGKPPTVVISSVPVVSTFIVLLVRYIRLYRLC